MPPDSILYLLGLAKKAGRLALGEEPVGAAARAHQAKLILLAADCAANTSRRAGHFAQAGGILFLHLPFTKEELGKAFGRTSVAMLCLNDAGFAGAVGKKLEQLDPEKFAGAAQQLEEKADRALQRQKEQRRHEQKLKKAWAPPPSAKSNAPPAPRHSPSKHKGRPSADSAQSGYKGRPSADSAQSGYKGRPSADSARSGYKGRPSAPQPGYKGQAPAAQPGYKGQASAAQPGYKGRPPATAQPGYKGQAPAAQSGYKGQASAAQPGYKGRPPATAQPGYKGRPSAAPAKGKGERTDRPTQRGQSAMRFTMRHTPKGKRPTGNPEKRGGSHDE